MRRNTRPPTAFLLLLASTACTLAGPVGVDGVDNSGTPGAKDLTLGWVSDYFGGGKGQVDGQPFEVTGARLRIAFDADSVKTPSCTDCVTVVLDSVFALANVRIVDAAQMHLSYDEGSVRHVLELRRVIGDGNVGNVVSAKATIGHIGVSSSFFDVTYLLARP